MKMTFNIEPGNNEIKTEAPNALAVITELAETVEPGMMIRGVREYEVDYRREFRASKNRVKDSLEIRRAGAALYTLGFRTGAIDGRVITNGGQVPFEGSFLILNGQPVNASSAHYPIRNGYSQKIVSNPLHSGDELVEAEEAALEIIKNDILSGDMQLTVSNPTDPRYFDSGFKMDIIDEPSWPWPQDVAQYGEHPGYYYPKFSGK